MQKKPLAALASGWILRPPVGIALLYGGAFVGLLLFLSVTSHFPTVWHEGPFRMLPSQPYWALTVTNVLLAAWLVGSLRSAWLAPPGLVRGQMIGVLFALVLVVVIQYGAQRLHRAWLEPIEDRVVIDAHVAGLPPHARLVVTDLRDLLAERLPGYRERLAREQLHVTSSPELGGWISTAGDTLSLELFGGPREVADAPRWDGQGSAIQVESRASGRVSARVSGSAHAAELAELQGFLSRWITHALAAE